MAESIVVRVKKVSTPLKRNILTLMDMGQTKERKMNAVQAMWDLIAMFRDGETLMADLPNVHIDNDVLQIPGGSFWSEAS